eukprot:2501252-Prymnesium_polylepis.1
MRVLLGWRWGPRRACSATLLTATGLVTARKRPECNGIASPPQTASLLGAAGAAGRCSCAICHLSCAAKDGVEVGLGRWGRPAVGLNFVCESGGGAPMSQLALVGAEHLRLCCGERTSWLARAACHADV